MSPLKISNISASNIGGTGIKIHGNIDVDIKDVSFKNVERPFDIDTTGKVSITGTTFPDNGRRPKKTSKISHSTVGFTGNEGPSLPAMCPDCNAIFPSRNYRIRTPEFYGRNNKDICPQCGGHEATVANGLFDLARETITVLQSEPLTQAMLAALQAAIAAHEGGLSTKQKLLEDVSQQSPKLGKLFEKALGLNAIAWNAFKVFALITTGSLATVELYDRFAGKPDHKNVHIEQTCMSAYIQACAHIVLPNDGPLPKKRPNKK
ncbi:hypothetical protein [Agrobacterium vitis]|uniref:hypothetical protein n=1 Tax=Agrobacterium vitis TaxID=373 RepID=UPI001F3CF75E|nr:hypothetical protein [Agrobacterium vitis]MCF1453382.1 hypothetical protein [Agrobacterium vitis]